MIPAVMIDIETFDLRISAIVVQVAAVRFDRETGEVLEPYCWHLTTDDQKDRTIDEGTVAWWMGQPTEVIQRVFPRTGHVCTARAMEELEQVCKDAAEVWAMPTSFDLGILRSLAGRDLVDHRKERCLRTLAGLYDPDWSIRRDATDTNPAPHDAVHDAMFQIRYLTALLRAMEH